MKKEYKPESLKDILQSRKKFYLGIVQLKFERVYKSGNMDYISRFEEAAVALGGMTAGKLENMAESSREYVSRGSAVVQEDTRPKLTFYQYSKARGSGMTNEQIKSKYRMKSPYQICGFAGTYAKRNKSQRKKK